MKNRKEQSVSSSSKRAENRYIPMESYLTKGKLSYIIPKKSKNSAVAFFDLGKKEPLVYDLRKWFKTGVLPAQAPNKENLLVSVLPSQEVRSRPVGIKAKTYLP